MVFLIVSDTRGERSLLKKLIFSFQNCFTQITFLMRYTIQHIPIFWSFHVICICNVLYCHGPAPDRGYWAIRIVDPGPGRVKRWIFRFRFFVVFAVGETQECGNIKSTILGCSLNAAICIVVIDLHAIFSLKSVMITRVVKMVKY